MKKHWIIIGIALILIIVAYHFGEKSGITKGKLDKGHTVTDSATGTVSSDILK